MKILRMIAYHLCQWTWGVVQNLVGLAFFVLLKKTRVEIYHGAVCSVYGAHPKSRLGCFALGSFIFIRDNVAECDFSLIRVHEYGHTVQSLFFGPLYLLAVALPSVIWAGFYNRHSARMARSGVAYTSRFPENSASRLGEKATKNKAMHW
ncbi:MAG: hypothetical protein IKI49_00375 [Oscillospiraceae bacterium]|nr:hypothetical protein [Oscillospiraceae bacterium]